jgi:hypothetical protein
MGNMSPEVDRFHSASLLLLDTPRLAKEHRKHTFTAPRSKKSKKSKKSNVRTFEYKVNEHNLGYHLDTRDLGYVPRKPPKQGLERAYGNGHHR